MVALAAGPHSHAVAGMPSGSFSPRTPATVTPTFRSSLPLGDTGVHAESANAPFDPSARATASASPLSPGSAGVILARGLTTEVAPMSLRKPFYPFGSKGARAWSPESVGKVVLQESSAPAAEPGEPPSRRRVEPQAVITPSSPRGADPRGRDLALRECPSQCQPALIPEPGAPTPRRLNPEAHEAARGPSHPNPILAPAETPRERRGMPYLRDSGGSPPEVAAGQATSRDRRRSSPKIGITPRAKGGNRSPQAGGSLEIAAGCPSPRCGGDDDNFRSLSPGEAPHRQSTNASVCIRPPIDEEQLSARRSRSPQSAVEKFRERNHAGQAVCAAIQGTDSTNWEIEPITEPRHSRRRSPDIDHAKDVPGLDKGLNRSNSGECLVNALQTQQKRRPSPDPRSSVAPWDHPEKAQSAILHRPRSPPSSAVAITPWATEEVPPAICSSPSAPSDSRGERLQNRRPSPQFRRNLGSDSPTCPFGTTADEELPSSYRRQLAGGPGNGRQAVIVNSVMRSAEESQLSIRDNDALERRQLGIRSPPQGGRAALLQLGDRGGGSLQIGAHGRITSPRITSPMGRSALAAGFSPRPYRDGFEVRGGGYAAALTDDGAAGGGGSLGPPQGGYERRHLQEPDHMAHASAAYEPSSPSGQRQRQHALEASERALEETVQADSMKESRDGPGSLAGSMALPLAGKSLKASGTSSPRSPRHPPRVGGSLHLGVGGRPINRGNYLGNQKTEAEKMLRRPSEDTIRRIYDDHITSLRTEIDQLQARQNAAEKRLTVQRSENRYKIEQSPCGAIANTSVVRQTTAPVGPASGKKLGVTRQFTGGPRAG